jgi:hypothetical protein
MNKMMHAVVFVVFGVACWFVSLILKLPMMVLPATARLRSNPLEPATALPAFTRLCMGAGPIILAVFALLALSYCIYVWVRKAERSASWTGFLATTMSALVVVLLPTVVAIYILVDFLNRSTAVVPK